MRGINMLITKKLNDELLNEAQKGNLPGIKLLLEEGAEIDAVDQYGQTALMKAIVHQHEKVSFFLIDKGADLDKQDCFKNTALMYTVFKAQEDVFKKLLEAGANPSLQDERGDKVSDLIYRCYQMATKENKPSYQEMMTEFVPDFVHLEKQRALMVAIVSNLDGVVSLMMEDPEVDVNETDGAGLTPLQWAAAFNQLKSAYCLIKSGAVLDYQDKHQMTALHYAAKNGYLEMSKLLLEEGAQIALMNNENKTPSMLAYEQNHLEVFEFLKKESLVRILQNPIYASSNIIKGRERE